MHQPLIILLCVIPLISGLISVGLINHRWPARLLGVVSLATVLVLALSMLISIRGGSILVTQMGGWAAPFGISLVFDSLSGLLLCAASAVALGAYIHSFSSLEWETERRYFHPLMQLLMFGVNMSFLTGDLFNLFVAFEVMLMASYALLAIGASRRQMTQAYKYVVLNLIASTIFVMAAAMAYGMLGTLNMADMARIVAETEADPTRNLPTGFTALAVLLLFVFALKGAFFPLWFWLPDTYYTCPIAVAGLFGGLLTKVGVYAIVRTFPLIFASSGLAPDQASPMLQTIIAISAGFTMLLAGLGAVSQQHVRRMLSIGVISQVGYMVFAIAIGIGAVGGKANVQAWALAGCVFYMIQHMVVKCGLILCGGVMESHAGTDNLAKLGGLLRRDTLLGVLFFILAMSLIGLPPLSGFFGKLVIIRAGWDEFWWLSVIGLVTGLLTLLSMIRIWSFGFWNPPQATEPRTAAVVKRSMRFAYGSIAMLVGLALFLGLGSEPVFRIAKHAGDQLANRQAYVTAVLGDHAFDKVDQLMARRERGAGESAKNDVAEFDATSGPGVGPGRVRRTGSWVVFGFGPGPGQTPAPLIPWMRPPPRAAGMHRPLSPSVNLTFNPADHAR